MSGEASLPHSDVPRDPWCWLRDRTDGTGVVGWEGQKAIRNFRPQANLVVCPPAAGPSRLSICTSHAVAVPSHRVLAYVVA